MGNIKSSKRVNSGYGSSVDTSQILHTSQYFMSAHYKIVIYILGVIGLSVAFANLASRLSGSVSNSVGKIGSSSLLAISNESVAELSPALKEATQHGDQTHSQITGVTVESKSEDGVTTNKVTFENKDASQEDENNTTVTSVTPANSGHTVVSVDNSKNSDGKTSTSTHNSLMISTSNHTQQQNNTVRTSSQSSTHLSSSSSSHSTGN